MKHEKHEHCHEEHGCGCENCKKAECFEAHEEEHEENRTAQIVMTAVSVILLALGLLPYFSEKIQLIFFVASAIFSGYELIPSALKEIKQRHLDENLLVLIAVVAAFIIGEGAEAAIVSLLFGVGEMLEDYAVDRSKSAIRKLYDITSDTAVRIDENGMSNEIDVSEVKIGDILLVSPFERVPVDCTALEDGGSVDASAITGEQIPVEIKKGMSVLSSSVNGNTAIKLEAAAEYKNSAAARIIETVEQSSKNKGNTDRFITRFARVYTPVVVCLAVLLAVVPSVFTHQWSEYIHRALVFLVAACPCALVLSIPLGFFAGIGAQSKKGIIVKGGKFIETLAKADAFLFDKTGTLTDSSFDIDEVICINAESEDEILKYAALAEKYSAHPLSEAVKNAYDINAEDELSDFSETPSGGTSVMYKGRRILCGKKSFLKEQGTDVEGDLAAQLFVSYDGKLLGAVSLSGHVRKESEPLIKKLRSLGIKKLIMLTGDSSKSAKSVAEKCALDGFEAELLPEQKTEYVKALQSKGHTVAFVGDGINDTPTLSSADVGVAMGSGTAAAIETGDIVLMNSNLENLAKSVEISRHTMRVVRWNIAFALAVKIIVLILGAFGFAPMWAAIFADVGVCIICVLNSARLLLDKK